MWAACKNNDEPFKEILMKISKVPKFVAKWALTLFMWKCREYY